MIDAGELARRLRLVVVTDRRLAAPKAVQDVVAAALLGGARTVQLRDKSVSARDSLALARRLRTMTLDAGALLIVNDRLDVALATGADGVHLGPDDLPVAAARRSSPPGFLVGFSADDPRVALQAQADGADYIGCGAVFGTTTKNVGGQAIGVEALDRIARAVTVPVVGIGGVTPAGATDIARHTSAAGTAVVGAIMAAPDPRVATEALLTPFRGR